MRHKRDSPATESRVSITKEQRWERQTMSRERRPMRSEELARHIFPCHALVGAWFAWQAEHSFANDVALNLIRAASDAVTGRAQHVFAPAIGAPLAGISDQTAAQDVTDHVRHPGHTFGPQQLAQRTFGAGCAALGQVRTTTQGMRLDLKMDVQIGKLLTDDRVVGKTQSPSGIEHLYPGTTGCRAAPACIL